MSQIFEIENIGTTPLIIIVAILLGCLLLGIYLWKKRFDSKASAFLGIVVLAIAATPISYFGVAGFSNNVEISSEGLTLNVPIYGRTIPLNEINLKEIRILDGSVSTEYSFSYRTNGIGLPNYNIGWFKSSKYTILAADTGSSHVIIPTANDYILIVSLKDPEGFIQTAKKYAQQNNT